MGNVETEKLQEICRNYLSRLYATAEKYGIGQWLKSLIEMNKNKQCHATEQEVEMLARCVDDERIARKDIPKMLGKSYRQCVERGDFDEIKQLRRVGIYSKVSALLFSKSKK